MTKTSDLVKVSNRQDKIKKSYLKLFRIIKKQNESFDHGFTTNVIKINSDYLIHNELMLVKCSMSGKIKWIHNSHKDIMTKVRLSKNRLEVFEFENRDHYFLDVKTGKKL